MWNQLQITHRFIVVLAAFVLSLVVVALNGLTGLSSARDSLKALHDEAMTRSLLASREQASGLTQINQAVAHLDGVTQQNAALVEQTSAAASALQDQASYLAGLANTFQLQAQHPQAVAAPALGRS